MNVGRIFDNVIGHEVTVQKLLAMLAANRMPNSLLFVGPSGQGKRLVALGLAQALLCEQSRQACGRCPSCYRVTAQQSEGLILLAPERGQIKIDSAREVVRQLSLANWGRARVVIIDDAHLLNPQAANALLKSIEEPPANTHFVLLTHSQESVLSTLRSRSQVVRFRGLSRDELAKIGQDSEDPETQKLATEGWNLLLQAEEPRVVEFIRENVESRESALHILRIWHGLARDRWLQDGDHRAWLSQASQKIMATEKDIAGNCDVQLALENFVYQVRSSHCELD